jgi:hypothetical protein
VIAETRPTAPAPARRSTVDVQPDPNAGAYEIWFRRIFLTLLALVVVVGAFDLLGVRSRTVSARSADGLMTTAVHYPQVARAGLGVPFTVTVHRQGGFHGDIVVGVSSSYLELFDRGAIDPEPASSTTTNDATLWRFDPPRGETFVASLDLQVQGGRHWGRTGTVTVSDGTGAGGRTLSSTFKTWLAP